MLHTYVTNLRDSNNALNKLNNHTVSLKVTKPQYAGKIHSGPQENVNISRMLCSSDIITKDNTVR